jgi:tetratricopeptide (TPR) repeat protein
MALAVAAPEALPVRAIVVAHAVMFACALPSAAVAMRASTPCPTCDVPPMSDGVVATDTTYTGIVQRARVASRRGEWNEAADLWRDALLVEDRIAEHWLTLGDVLARAERHREAVAAYQRAIQLDIRLTREGTRAVARAYARMGDDRQAVRWLELALRAGVTPDEVWSEDTFSAYRNDPRLRVPQRLQVRSSGAAGRRGSVSV